MVEAGSSCAGACDCGLECLACTVTHVSERGAPASDTSIFFPLHTSVELFEDRNSPAAVVRAKEAAVLYDRLLFETGMLDVSIATAGSWISWKPEQALTPDVREQARQVVPMGTEMVIAIGKEEEYGVPAPAEAMRHLQQGGISAQYIAEFHTGILDELAQFDADWVRVVEGSAAHIPRSDPLGERIATLDWSDLRDQSLLRDRSRQERAFIYKAFNRDATLAAAFGSAFSVTPLFNPMVQRHGLAADLAGSGPLAFAVPHVGALPWEAVVEFRDHDGSREARAKLREFDELAARGDAESANAHLLAVGQELTAVLFQAIKDQRKGLPEQMAEEAIKTAVSFLPVVGPAVESVSAVTQMVVEERRFNRSWIAALMTLQQRS